MIKKRLKDLDGKMPPKDPPPQSTVDSEIEGRIAQSKLRKEKLLRKKKRIKMGVGATVAVLLSYGIYVLFKPYEGSMAYGICKVFLELNVQYPQSLRLSTVEELGSSVRIWYTQVDSFGATRMEPLQCYFRQDPVYGFVLDKVTMNRRDVDPGIVARFNTSLPVVLQNLPDLALPTALPDSLQNLQFETDKFRRPVI